MLFRSLFARSAAGVAALASLQAETANAGDRRSYLGLKDDVERIWERTRNRLERTAPSAAPRIVAASLDRMATRLANEERPICAHEHVIASLDRASAGLEGPGSRGRAADPLE